MFAWILISISSMFAQRIKITREWEKQDFFFVESKNWHLFTSIQAHILHSVNITYLFSPNTKNDKYFLKYFLSLISDNSCTTYNPYIAPDFILTIYFVSSSSSFLYNNTMLFCFYSIWSMTILILFFIITSCRISLWSLDTIQFKRRKKKT